jgi:hypothetical protein
VLDKVFSGHEHISLTYDRKGQCELDVQPNASKILVNSVALKVANEHHKNVARKTTTATTSTKRTRTISFRDRLQIVERLRFSVQLLLARRLLERAAAAAGAVMRMMFRLVALRRKLEIKVGKLESSQVNENCVAFFALLDFFVFALLLNVLVQRRKNA